jgi:alkylation response protein AidB-like acyl-CoA dehydrogenase
MDILLDEDEEMLKNNAREFFEQECPTSLVRAMEEDELGYPADVWRKIADLGWLGFALPQTCGGDDAPLEQLGLLLEEMGRAVAPLPFLSTIVPALTIAEAGTEALRRELLPRVARGELLLTWALTERDPRGTPETIHTEAVPDGDHYLVNGSKLFVDNFNVADQCLVVCRTGQASAAHQGISLLLLDTTSQGISHTLLPTLAGDKQSEVTLNQVRVPTANLIGMAHRRAHDRAGNGPAVCRDCRSHQKGGGHGDRLRQVACRLRSAYRGVSSHTAHVRRYGHLGRWGPAPDLRSVVEVGPGAACQHRGGRGQSLL